MTVRSTEWQWEIQHIRRFYQREVDKRKKSRLISFPNCSHNLIPNIFIAFLASWSTNPTDGLQLVLGGLREMCIPLSWRHIKLWSVQTTITILICEANLILGIKVGKISIVLYWIVLFISKYKLINEESWLKLVELGWRWEVGIFLH